MSAAIAYTCPLCGASFVSSGPRATYCTDKCRHAAYRQRSARARELLADMTVAIDGADLATLAALRRQARAVVSS